MKRFDKIYRDVLFSDLFADRRISLIEDQYTRFVHIELVLVDHHIADDMYAVAFLAEPGRRTVQHDLARTGTAGYNICLKSCTIAEVDDLNALVRQDIGFLQENLVDGHAAFIIKIGAGNTSVVKFRFQQCSLHGILSFKVMYC